MSDFAPLPMPDPVLQDVCARLIHFLETSEVPPDLFTEDVFCDFTPPLWRVQARGVADVVALRHRGHPGASQVTKSSVQPTPQGFVMELEERWQDTQGPWYCREAIVAALRGPSISRLVVYCTGDWNAERQAAHAAQVKLLEA